MDKLFDTKRTYTGYDGETYVNMCIPVVSIKSIIGHSMERVNQDGNGRLDNFVWQIVGKNMNMIDITMYANHIFNPFAVKEGDILYVPNDNDRVYVSSAEPSLPDGTKHSNNTNWSKEMSYAEKVAYLAKKGFGVK